MRGSGGGAGREGGTHLRGATGVGGVRGAIDSSFNLVATHPSCRRRGKRAKAKEGLKGWRGRSSSVEADAGTGGGEPYLFECVVARDKNDGESLKSMWHSTATLTRRQRHRHLAESRKLNTCVSRVRRPT